MKPGLKVIKIGQKVKIPTWQYQGLTPFKSYDLIGEILNIEDDKYTILVEENKILELCCNEFSLI